MGKLVAVCVITGFLVFVLIARGNPGYLPSCVAGPAPIPTPKMAGASATEKCMTLRK